MLPELEEELLVLEENLEKAINHLATQALPAPCHHINFTSGNHSGELMFANITPHNHLRNRPLSSNNKCRDARSERPNHTAGHNDEAWMHTARAGRSERTPLQANAAGCTHDASSTCVMRSNT